MSKFRKAARAFEDFTGHKPSKVSRSRLSDTDVTGWQMGPVVGIAYEAKRDGAVAQYFHEFAKRARPNLVAREDGGELFLQGGKYKVTDRGIEDMPELFIVNPSKRPGAASKGKTVMARATTRRRVNGRFVKMGAKPKPRQVAIFNSNPVKRRRTRVAKVAKVTRRRFRRNPVGLAGLGPMKGIGELLMPAFGVGAGAVGTELLMGYLPIPAGFKSGVMRHVTKGVVGVAAGWALASFLKQRRLGFFVMAGAVVIATHDAIKEFIANQIPDAKFGQYVAPLSTQFGGMGYVNSAQTLRLGQYVAPLSSQFDGMSQAYDVPGGETDFRA